MFKDVDENRWSYKDIERVTRAGLMSGYPDGNFAPGRGVTREEMASIISRQMFRERLFADVLPHVLPALVRLGGGDGWETGVLVSPEGHLVTGRDLVRGREKVAVVREGWGCVDAPVLAASAHYDLALIKYPGPVSNYLSIHSGEVLCGDHIGIVGGQPGYTGSFTQGQVRYSGRQDYFRTDAPLSDGSGGGVAINERGEIVGLVVSGPDPVDGVGLAVCLKAGQILVLLRQNSVPLNY